MHDLGKKQIFKKYSYRGNDLKKLLRMSYDEMSLQLYSRKRRMCSKYGRFIKKLMKTKKATVLVEKTVIVKALLRNRIANMVKSVINFC